MDPQNPSVDAMETCGEEVWLFKTGTCAHQSDYSIQRGKEGARMLSGDATVSW
jgi:hypothetical protein